MAYKRKQYMIRPLFDLLAGKSVDINAQHTKIMRFMANFILYPFFRVFSPVSTFSISMIIFLIMYYAYVHFNVYNPVVHFLWAIYYCFVVSQMVSTLVCTFGFFVGFSLYVKFRFNEVNKKFRSRNLKNIVKSIKEHKLICDYIEEINNIAAPHLTIFYLGLVFSFDISLYLSLYGHNPIIRIVMAYCCALLLFGFFLTYYSCALFVSEAHRPYKIINSLMVKRRLRITIKWKVSLTCFIFI